MVDVAGRHPSTVATMRLFNYDHLPPELATVFKPFADRADELVAAFPDDPLLTTALIKLWESKNCAVALAAIQQRPTREA